MKITKELLMAHNPCTTPERIEGFLACFPGGVVTLEGAQKAKTYNLDWVARKLLPPARQAEYQAKTAPLQAEYQAKIAPLLADYWAKIAPLYNILFAEYREKTDPLWAEYQAKIAPAFYEAFREEMAISGLSSRWQCVYLHICRCS